MIIPVRCFSCGKPIGHLWEEYKKRSAKEKPEKILSEMGVKRYCCRAQFIGHLDLLDNAAPFKKF